MLVARVVVHAVVGLMLVLIARVIVIVFVVEFPQPVSVLGSYTLYTALPANEEVCHDDGHQTATPEKHVATGQT